MTRSITKRVYAGLIAVLLAMMAVLALAPSAFAADDDVVFTVYTSTLTGFNDDNTAKYSDPVAAKTYTAAELQAIAETKDAADAPAYLMFTSKRKKTTVYVAPEYVTLTKLLEDVGVANPKAVPAILYYTKDEGTSEDVIYSSVSLSGAALLQDLMFYPSHVSMTESYDASNNAIPNEIYDTEGAYAVPAIIALKYASADIKRADNATAESARLEAAAKTPEAVQRSFFGLTIDEYQAELPMGGTASVNNASGILVYLNSIEGAVVGDIPTATYTGKAITPNVNVTLYDKPLKAGADYEVSCANNVNAGTAKVTIEGTGELCGAITKTFTIAQATNKLTAGKAKVSKSFKVKKLKKKAATFKLPTAKATFGQVKWSVAKKDAKKVLKLKSGKVTVKKGAKKGKYTIKLKASVAGTANYAGASKTITVTVNVKK